MNKYILVFLSPVFLLSYQLYSMEYGEGTEKIKYETKYIYSIGSKDNPLNARVIKFGKLVLLCKFFT